VDCNNDGINEATAQTGTYTCDYAAAGTYTIRIKDNTGLGTGFPRISFDYQGDSNKLLTIEQWGTGKWTSMYHAFAGCFNLAGQAVDSPDLSGVTNMSGMFQHAINFNQPIGNWNVASVTDMSSMFASAESFNQDIGSWNTANVTNMYAMFSNARAFNQNIGSWNTANVINMSAMFADSAFNQDIGGWNIASVITMTYMFEYATLSTDNYDALLIGWSAQTLKPNVTFSSGNSQYCLGESARNAMISTYNWTIKDGGKNCQISPVLTWSNPVAIDQGTPLSDTQFNATANVPGIFTYTPASGTYLSIGVHTLHVDFVPTDTVNYSNASKDVSITVNDHALFTDVPADYWARNFIERLYFNQVTGGCGASPLTYCPTKNVTRAQMAVFVLRAVHGSTFAPPDATGTVFTDVPADSFAAAWIEQLAAEGITGGCGGGKFCPNAPVTRAQMAVFLVKAMYGTGYTPPTATGEIFADIPADGFAASFIEQLFADGITGGCGGGDFCPNNYITRAEMAVFLVRAFNLP
jgi:surface protein